MNAFLAQNIALNAMAKNHAPDVKKAMDSSKME